MPGPSASRTVWTAALLAFAVFAIIVHSVWTAACRRRPDPGRNPFLKRGWYEYVRQTPPRQPGEELIVVLGNSQGYGIEVEASAAYPAILQDSLHHDGRNARVVNWAVHGGQYADLITLAAAARDKNPSTLIIVASSAFHRRPAAGAEARSLWSSDAYYLLAHKHIRSRIPPDILCSMTDLSLRFDFALARLWAGWRIRNLPTSYLAEKKPLAPYFPEHSNLSWLRSRRKLAPAPGGTARILSRPSDPHRAATLFGVATGSAPDVIFINMPAHSRRRDPNAHDWPWIEELCRESGIRVFDFRHALPDNKFPSLSHFNRAGHREMAERVREVLQ